MESIIQLMIIFVTMIVCLLAGDYRISCFFLCGCIAALFIVNRLYYRKKEKQTEEMINYLMKVQDGLQLPDMTKCNEGQLGILQSEIYKLVVLLKEQAGIAKREKSYLAGMLSDISHQIKTPITAITLMTDLLKEPGLPEEKRLECITRIDKQVSKITWLIRNLLTLSQLEADMLELKKEQVEVRQLLEKACQSLTLLAEVKGVDLSLETHKPENYKSGERMYVVCDEGWTAEALSNIIKNCVEHTPEGGEVRITVSQHNFATNIVIRDNGQGISKEDLPHIFERFYKGRHGSKDSVGIGLAMAKQVILRQNGVITVESEEGKGSTFYVKLYSEVRM
ncbi:MAG: HAMP domain-containing histidine kinase [Lachnospiraceae bacterium]|nr:HAMP domain-containing histidine kinase [Lachnospiraceae bacterium]